MRVAAVIELNDAQRQQLQQWARGRSIAYRLVKRAEIILLAADGLQDMQIASKVGTDRHTVARWRERFLDKGVQGLVKDAPREGRKPSREIAERIVKATTQSRPSNATHWSTRTLAKELNVSHSMVSRVWHANNLKPHLMRTFKISNDPDFVAKVIDVVGLYLNPPERALVLSADEKSQIQALDRTQKGLPIKKGRCGTMTHDYKRNGTTTLFAALEVASGRVIGTCMQKHRHQEWIKFLELIDTETPQNLALHLIVDNYSTHKHPKVKRWLKRHPRFHMHFTPTSSSWLNLIERWFREITDKRIRRGVFHRVDALIKAINDYIQNHNKEPHALVWTKKADEILEKVARARKSLHKALSA